MGMVKMFTGLFFGMSFLGFLNGTPTVGVYFAVLAIVGITSLTFISLIERQRKDNHAK